MWRIFLFLFFALSLQANPFAIDFPERTDISNEDYLEIQRQLRAIDIKPLIRKLYVADQSSTTYEDFLARCSKGISQTLIDPEKGYFPVANLEKIGQGGDTCIVCCAPFDGVRSSLIQSIPKALQECGYNGYFYYRIGGFPNPTGREIQFVGVPYSFKIFMMVEAQKLGFNKVIWVDSACLPLNDPTPLFKRLESKDILLIPNKCNIRFLFPATRSLLKEITGIDASKAIHPFTPVFGLKMDAKHVKCLVEDYYNMAKLGTPFLSCFPEEYVLAVLISKYFHPHFLKNPLSILKSAEDNENIDRYRAEGFFFYHRRH